MCRPCRRDLAGRSAAVWSLLQPAKLQFLACLQAAKVKPLDAGLLAALSSAWSVLRMACGQTLAAQGAGGSSAIELLRPQWEQMMLQDQAAVEVFNQAVADHNHALRQFPAGLLAWLVGFRAARTL